ncbi:MAG: hypothetical protein APF80_16280 [Alphaproteobacteria bacterium BRH_c36]|nr:MAG: hypothetical protein APF80_16280 [Alphaproteobacteria bacterium BRH_c36]
MTLRNKFHDIIVSPIAAFGQDRAANISLMFAGSCPVIVACAALAIDVGSLYTERRQVQGAVDLAAIAAAADLGHAEQAALQTLDANAVGTIKSLRIEPGRFDPDPQLKYTERFTVGATPANAVKVSLVTERPYFFAKAFLDGSADVAAEAIAATSSHATFSIGSRLLAVRDGLPNQLLEALIGGKLELSVMDYNALASAEISLGDQMDAIAGELNLTAGTYREVLKADATVENWIAAAAAVTGRNGDTRAQATLEKLLAGSDTKSLSLPLEKLISLGPFGSASVGEHGHGLTAVFNALELVTAAAQIANVDHQVSLKIDAGLPGIANLSLDIAIGEPPQFGGWASVGLPQATIYTAQTRLRLIAEVGGEGSLSGAALRLPVFLDVATASARLNSVACVNGSSNRAAVTIAAKPGILSAWIGEPTYDWRTSRSPPAVGPAQIVEMPLLKVRGSAFIEATNTNETLLNFSHEDVANRAIKRVDTTDIGQTVISSLLRNLHLHADVGGLGLGLPGGVQDVVANTLSNVAKPLDEVLATVLETLGVHLGEVDVRVHGAACGSAVLAG